MSVRDAFRAQAAVCVEMGSPFTARLCALVADRLAPGDPVSERILSWPGDAGGRGDALPLRLAGALHAVVLDGTDPKLAAHYPPYDGATDDDLWTAIASAFADHADHILARLDSPPQTNETMRSAALAPGFLTIAARTSLPLLMSELGASAGLNLAWDRFFYRFGTQTWGDPAAPVQIAPDWHGPAPPLPSLTVAGRAGCDRAPPDLNRTADRQRLLSFVWADQTARKQRMEAAIDTALAAGITVDRADAVDWLEARLAMLHPGQTHVIYHSIFWQYLAPPEQERARARIDAAGARATGDAPLAWLRMEGDGDTPGAAITLTHWPDGATRLLGRADFHGRWIRWTGWH